MIKIESTSKVRSSFVKKAKKKSSSLDTFNLGLGEEISEVKSPAGVSPIATINSLLSLQEVQINYDNKKEVKHGFDMIDQLKQLQLSIASGAVSEQNLLLLTNMVKQTKDKFADPILVNILEEIELRIGVELAKLSKLVK